MESGSVGSGPPSASPSPPSPAHAFVGRNKHEIRIEKLPDNAAEDAKRKKIAELTAQLKACTDAGNWEQATSIMAELRSKELRQTSLKIRKERINPTSGDITGMLRVEAQLIKSLAKVRADIHLVQHRGRGAQQGHLELPLAKWATVDDDTLLRFLTQISSTKEGMLEKLLGEQDIAKAAEKEGEK